MHLKALWMWTTYHLLAIYLCTPTKWKLAIHCVTLPHPRKRSPLTKPTRLLMDPQPQDDNEPEAIEYRHYTHEIFFQSLSLPRSEDRQSGSFALTNISNISEGTSDYFSVQ